MQNKQSLFNFKGMVRDISPLNITTDHAFKIENMRLATNEDGSFLALTNEKGNNKLSLDRDIIGAPIGQAVFNNELVLFTTLSDSTRIIPDISSTELSIADIEFDIEESCTLGTQQTDYIYSIDINTNTVKELFVGDLNFKKDHPIETLLNYENDGNIKVYWTDGLNPFRVINIKAIEDKIGKWTKESFNSVVVLDLKEQVSIKKNYYGGSFSPGTIQYAFTYYNLYGQESNIFYTSDLYYTSFKDRGGSPEDKVSNSFEITINNIDTRFDYVRIYSIHRTSIDATPSVKVVTDIKVSSTIKYIDTNTTGYTIDPVSILYLGGESIITNTIAQKDGTLFLGNFEIEKNYIDKEIKEFFNNFSDTKKIYLGPDDRNTTDKKKLFLPNDESYYSYENQLKYSSRQIKTFKYLETYRFGVQFQHKTGKWSEPIWIEDNRCEIPIQDTYYSDSTDTMPIIGTYNISDGDVIKKLVNSGYVKVRPVVVYPTEDERECICQGILCPTVYYAKDRTENAPFAQSSWFIRPNTITTIGKSHDKGEYLEFRHNKAIPNNKKRNAEIQILGEVFPDNCYNDQDINYIYNNFYIDQSILTLHSPDIEFGNVTDHINSADIKLRIVGIVPMTAFNSDISVVTSSDVLPYKSPLSNGFASKTKNLGLYKKEINAKNVFDDMGPNPNPDSYYGSSSMASVPLWVDGIYNSNEHEEGSTFRAASKIGAFVLYPWHKEGSLNNTPAEAAVKYSELKRKVISNLKYSYKSKYFNINEIWNAYEEEDEYKTGISDVVVCNSNEVTLYKLKAPERSNRTYINYYNNIDKIVSFGNYPVYYQLSGVTEMEKFREELSETFISDSFEEDYFNMIESSTYGSASFKGSVSMKYKTTPHAVMALNYSKTEYKNVILPTININGSSMAVPQVLNNSNKVYKNGIMPFWEENKNSEGVHQDILDIPDLYDINHGFLWLGELYRDNMANKFGGTTEEAFENNQWLPCGESVSLIKASGNPEDAVSIAWTDGDTYYQRYDHLKTYPFTQEDTNSIVEIVSFMCETRVNLDGRYDRNRGLQNNLSISPQNFNLLNTAYSQQDNIFVYRGLNTNKQVLNKFPTTVTWTKTKTAGELIDTWTNITLASTLDFDGSKGPINAIRKLNNNLIVFQDDAIADLLYNSNAQIASTTGVPIEIANSGKVDGKRYFSEIGCTNKWSICTTPQGLYFVSKSNKDIYCYADKLYNLSSTLQFTSWINGTYKNYYSWDPENFKNIIAYYDSNNKDVLFITEDQCLAYSERVGQFTSFYSYNNVPYISNIDNKVIAIKSYGGYCELWEQNAGEYNMFFGEYKPFGITFISNGKSGLDKIFNTVDLNVEISNSGIDIYTEPFDTLKTWNSYQEGLSTLKDIKGYPSTTKRKFRTWRVNIPRDISNGRDRMRNPWLYLEFTKQIPNTNKTVLHDIMINYFE